MEGKTLTKKEIDELFNLNKKDYTELINKDSTTNKEKKQIILRIKERERLLIEAGFYPELKLQDLASLIYKKLQEYGISYYKSGHYYDLFSEEEKHSEKNQYGTNFPSPEGDGHKHLFVVDENNPDLQRCNCGVFTLYEIMYSGKPLELETEETEKKSEDSTQKSSNIVTPEKKQLNPYDFKPSELFYRAKSNAERLSDILEDILKKYAEPAKIDEKTGKEIPPVSHYVNNFYLEDGMDIDKEIQEQKDIEAQLLAIDKMTDFRQRIGAFEKIKAKLLIMTTYHIHKVAKMLNCSAKHLKNDVLNKDIEDDIKFFRTWPCKCAKCGNVTQVDIADEMNQILIKAKNNEEVEMVKV